MLLRATSAEQAAALLLRLRSAEQSSTLLWLLLRAPEETTPLRCGSGRSSEEAPRLLLLRLTESTAGLRRVLPEGRSAGGGTEL